MRDGPPATGVLVICTGNAARSVMAGFMLERLADRDGIALEVVTAGTLAVEGQPMSMRTRAAIASIDELADVPVSHHRSRQLTDAHLRRADLVVAMEADHVRYVRRRHAEAAGRTATLRRLVRDLAPEARPLADRVADLRLAEVEVDPSEEVADPAGRPDEAYLECARELWSLCRELAPRLGA